MPQLINPLKYTAAALLVMVAVLSGCQSEPSLQYCSASSEPFKHTLCQVQNTKKSPLQLELIWRDPLTGERYSNFKKLHDSEHYQDQAMIFALNAGMYDQDFAPLAHFVENGEELKSLNLKSGGGNFHLLPNGVYWIDQNGVSHVTQTLEYDKIRESRNIEFATQSGPMLVIDGKIHPRFDPHSTSKKIRSGVGVCRDRQVRFIISDVWVNFYEFAQLFQSLGCDNALFLDGGTAPALMSAELHRSDLKDLGPMVLATLSR